MLMQVITMTPAQVQQLPPTERDTFTQLVGHSVGRVLKITRDIQRQVVGLPI